MIPEICQMLVGNRLYYVWIGDSTNTVIDKMMHTFTADSPFTDFVLKSLLEELMSG